MYGIWYATFLSIYTYGSKFIEIFGLQLFIKREYEYEHSQSKIFNQK